MKERLKAADITGNVIRSNRGCIVMSKKGIYLFKYSTWSAGKKYRV